MVRSRRGSRGRRRPLGERTGGKILAMVSIDERDPRVAGRRVPGAWEGDLIIGRAGQGAAAALVERTSRFVIIAGLPEGKNADPLADVLIDIVNAMPDKLRQSLTRVSRARRWSPTPPSPSPPTCPSPSPTPHSPCERPTNDNTNGLIRAYLPKDTDITSHQPYLDAIADELGDQPRAVLGYLTPREVFTKLLLDNQDQPESVAITG